MTVIDDTRQKVLIIDDEPAVLNLFEAILEDEFQVEKCDNTEDGVQALHCNKPDLIILDINLGSAHGIEVAKMIKMDPENKDIPILFVSGLATKDDRIQGYEVGASDFICKPFVTEEVLHKIRLHIKFNAEVREKNQMIDETRQMAFAAMSQSGEIGQVLHFMRDSFECDTYEKIANRILEYMDTQQLNTAIIIKTDPPLYFTHDSEIARLDKEILDRLNILERIIDFGKRSIYNFKQISILVKDMPVHDEGFYGRIKDNVCLILEAADAKIIGINNDLVLQKHNKSISEAIESSKNTLKEIESSFQENAKKNTGIMLQLKDQIDSSFVQLGLSEAQEKEIADIIDEAETKSTALYDTGLQIEDRISTLVEKFSQLIDNDESGSNKILE